MLWIKRILYLFVFLVAVVMGAWFAIDNNQVVSVTVMGFPLPKTSIGVLLLGFLLIGGLVGIVVSLVPYVSVKKQVILLNRKLNGYEKEIAKLRMAPLRN